MLAAGQTMAQAADSTQGAAPAQSATAPTTQVSMVADAGVAQPETRAQVYQDLVHSEHDGQIKQLNSTIYAHH
ncbi:DUF4148 domain-containing protein [Pararobbsia silviterrae]|uniref:DUF4148 domain-containing protein n=2 Tax=Pararobbsia silviterrae TaxID=1792498 RepID=A0A494XMS8_9BURK|nr:DUF4148 domain-containing protein [Pararobbsia silviterrae]